jgi:anhydro-N-acetylmuramic acid kinase
MPEYYIGLMSGTSLDGVDAVLADFADDRFNVLAHADHPFEARLRAELFALSAPGGGDELRRAALVSNQLAHTYAAAIRNLLGGHAVDPSTVRAIGCHGQTVRHQPADGYTLQLVNGALLAELTGINVVCDFRSRDVAAGGQGAPLVPAFHRAAFASRTQHRVIVNIGGIANLTSLPPSGAVTGFDCGPGNLLLDTWAQHHLGKPFDDQGRWADSGRVSADLLARMLDHEYFRRAPPKSTGRETFNREWLVGLPGVNEKPADVQATLLALTVQGITGAIARYCAGAEEIYICGGGARNCALMEQLARELAPLTVAVTDELGVTAQLVEALAFAWLARQNLSGLPGNLPAVTGANSTCVLGALYRA